jgi:hypothetical protein
MRERERERWVCDLLLKETEMVVVLSADIQANMWGEDDRKLRCTD